jgi:broad specificity phosphatase PhoE
MNTVRLYVVRHGAVASRDRFYGHLDVELSDEGRRQIEQAADALDDLDVAAVHCSDLSRAEESARIIAARHGLEPRPDPAFREMNLGVLEGVPFAEARERHPELHQKRYKDMWSYRFPGGGENLQDIADRCRPALRRIVEQGGAQVLAAHNSVNRVVLADALGLTLDRAFDFAQDFGCINCVEYAPERTRVLLLNWTPAAPA